MEDNNNKNNNDIDSTLNYVKKEQNKIREQRKYVACREESEIRFNKALAKIDKENFKWKMIGWGCLLGTVILGLSIAAHDGPDYEAFKSGIVKLGLCCVTLPTYLASRHIEGMLSIIKDIYYKLKIKALQEGRIVSNEEFKMIENKIVSSWNDLSRAQLYDLQDDLRGRGR